MALKYSQLGKRQKPSEITRMMSTALARPDLLSLAAGFTDTATLPLQQVQSLISKLPNVEAEDKALLQYGSNQGRPELRALLARRLEDQDGQENNAYSDDSVFVTNGSQQGLYLAMQTLCDPGDFVLVEQPTYFVFLEILSGLGINAVPMPMTSNGEVDTNELSRQLDAMHADGRLERLKALYMVSYFANPSGHSIALKTKSILGKLLSEKAPHVGVIEDAAYRDLYFDESYEGSSILALESYRNLSVFYSSTLTKPFASGLRVGYGLCSDADWLEKMLDIKGQQDFGTSNFAQAVLQRALEEGVFDEHLGCIRHAYAEKMHALHDAVLSRLANLGWAWQKPTGGLYLWLQAPGELRTDFDSDFHKACLEKGVIYVPGDLCCANRKPKDRIRLSYGVLSVEHLRKAADRFCNAAERMALPS